MKKIVSTTIILCFTALSLSQDISGIKLKDINGKNYDMKKNLDNDANIVLFWATWCMPCQKEFPAIEKILKKHPDKKINVIAISKDSPRSMAKVKSFVRKHNYPFTYLLDADGKMSSNFMVDAIPHSFLADGTGKVVYSHTGYRKGDELDLEKELLKLWQE
jgi:cytochrome c biogenesis protein CcmG, thiol:disulfide interchange protein DsbE